MRVTIVGWSYDADLKAEEALLARYTTLTGWSEAVHAAGVDEVTVVQRFHRESTQVHNGVTYRFCSDGAGSRLSSWAVSPALTAAVVASTPDVVHVNGLGFPIQTWRLRQHLSPTTAVIVQDHASGVPQAPPRTAWATHMRHALRRRAMRAVDAYFFTSAEQAEPWRAAGFIRDGQRVAAVAESSTDMRQVARDTARGSSGVTGDPAVLWVGRLNANKDPLCVIDACAIALAARPGLTLTMVYQDAELLTDVQHRIAQSPGLVARVRLAGAVPHDRLPYFYSAADVFALGSHHEGSGYALIEACACGLPPAVSDIPSFRALTGPGAAGRLWPAGRPKECAAAILAVDAARCHERARVREHFDRTLSWEAVGRHAHAAYALVVDDRRARGSATDG